jgi:hypothetical protein
MNSFLQSQRQYFLLHFSAMYISFFFEEIMKAIHGAFLFLFLDKIHHANQQIVYSFLFLLDSLQRKWLPVHTLAASGEFYLMDALLKHNVDINAVDVVGGMTMC